MSEFNNLISMLNDKNDIILSQQAKIDELQAKAQMCRDEKTHAISRWSALCKERDELQARIDKVICILDKGICHVGYETLFNILTGEDQ